ncbi:hypothetical protein AMAG_18257 [Allomyces macrogynus ATCC 38327]|uniref:Myb-like domain-containing protein n=1 Tax=Allomyces macrogynus (strain ATCC 38327) TaxID=578462 RepID=A0A0L0S7V5_ALLM3|nr:hypothetical protein AMAG_18257 [Allomyces macrogynus ATCC 38327]|eukprot:KNE58490.1 hypothetical protein AMAG_18257 [Allomyces macrogynus ATCC 38327]
MASSSGVVPPPAQPAVPAASTTSTTPNAAPERGARGPNWQPAEDELLARSWLAALQESGREITISPSLEVWGRIYAKWLAHRNADLQHERTQSALQSRWADKLYKSLVKFGRVLTQAYAQAVPGTPHHEVEQRALGLYAQDSRKGFRSLGAYNAVRHLPRFAPQIPAGWPQPVTTSAVVLTSGGGSSSNSALVPAPVPVVTPIPVIAPHAPTPQQASHITPSSLFATAPVRVAAPSARTSASAVATTATHVPVVVHPVPPPPPPAMDASPTMTMSPSPPPPSPPVASSSRSAARRSATSASAAASATATPATGSGAATPSLRMTAAAAAEPQMLPRADYFYPAGMPPMYAAAPPVAPCAHMMVADAMVQACAQALMDNVAMQRERYELDLFARPLADLDPDQQEYFRTKRRRVIERMRQGGETVGADRDWPFRAAGASSASGGAGNGAAGNHHHVHPHADHGGPGGLEALLGNTDGRY